MSTVHLTGSYSGAGYPTNEKLAGKLTADNQLSLDDLKKIAAQSDPPNQLSRYELVKAGFSQADADRLIQALGKEYAALKGGLVIDLNTPVKGGQCLAKDSFQGLTLGAPDKAGCPPLSLFPSEEVEGPVPARWHPITREVRQDVLLKLQERALELRNQGVPGVEIWSKMTAYAMELYQDKGVTSQQMADFVTLDLAIVFVGPASYKYLNDYAWVASQDPKVDEFLEDFKALGLDQADEGGWIAGGYATMGLDGGKGESFRPEINDKTNNQIYHTSFYHFMGYATQDLTMVQAGSYLHEIKDGGSSVEDHNAGMLGGATGMLFRSMRDSGDAKAAVEAWPDLISAAYGKDGGPRVQAGTASPLEKGVALWADHWLHDDSWTETNIKWGGQNMMIQLKKWITG